MQEDLEKVKAGLIARDPAIVDVLRDFSSAQISSSEAAERLGEMVRELDDFLGRPKG